METVPPYREGALKICCGKFVTIRKSKFRRESRFVRKTLIAEYRTALYGWGSWRGFPYYVTERGEKLPERMSVKLIRRVFRMLLTAIGEMHRAGYLYCDPKKENIVLVHGVPKMVDFGSVMTIRGAELRPRRIGTWKYMAKEVDNGISLLPASNSYAVGAFLQDVCEDRRSRRIFGNLVSRLTDPDIETRPTMQEALGILRHSNDWLWRWMIVVGGAVLMVVGVCAVFTAGRVLETAILEADEKAFENADADAVVGLMHMKHKEYDKAFVRLMKAAKVPGYANVDVFRAIGECYRFGLGVDADAREALRWERAARGDRGGIDR